MFGYNFSVENKDCDVLLSLNLSIRAVFQIDNAILKIQNMEHAVKTDSLAPPSTSLDIREEVQRSAAKLLRSYARGRKERSREGR